MKENQDKLKRNFEIFKPYIQSTNLNTEMYDNLETIYYTPESSEIKDGYFVAEFWIPYCDGVFIKEKSFKISHVFRLDIQQIEAELNKISDAEKSRFETLLNPKNIAFVLKSFYIKFIPYLSGENGKEDYGKIAEILYNYYGFIIGSRYGQ
ncbi:MULTISPECIES: hypothetical protein [Flavobacterium]|jgi:hypothetical protein|uniref:Uncharacterized protein n=2 Tax=Flavobacterium TaxID=237 RepID=A0ABP7UWR7_9FLAO